jgi:hypothetical protein
MKRRRKERVSRDARKRGTSLAQWLNGDSPDAEIQASDRRKICRVLGLVKDLHRALPAIVSIRTRIIPRKRAEGEIDEIVGEELKKHWGEVRRIELELEKHTRRYRSYPQFLAESDGSGIGVAHVWKCGGSLDMLIALETVEKLVRLGLLENLSFCEECKRRWVFRYGEKGRYCSTKCRQAPYERTPARKRQISENAAARYRLKKLEEAREKKQKERRNAKAKRWALSS